MAHVFVAVEKVDVHDLDEVVKRVALVLVDRRQVVERLGKLCDKVAPEATDLRAPPGLCGECVGRVGGAGE
eukprot:363457-Chlamydomonas_euryale.AAC.6